MLAGLPGAPRGSAATFGFFPHPMPASSTRATPSPPDHCAPAPLSAGAFRARTPSMTAAPSESPSARRARARASIAASPFLDAESIAMASSSHGSASAGCLASSRSRPTVRAQGGLAAPGGGYTFPDRGTPRDRAEETGRELTVAGRHAIRGVAHQQGVGGLGIRRRPPAPRRKQGPFARCEDVALLQCQHIAPRPGGWVRRRPAR